MYNWLKKNSEYLADAFLLLSILFLGIHFLEDLESSLDLAFSDEVNYMIRGLQLGKVNLFPDDSPLYAVCYYLMHFIEADAISLYYLNWKVTAILPALLFYLMLRVHKVGNILSLFYSISLLFSHVNITNWPRISNFCICFVFTVLIIYRIAKYNYNKLFLLSIFTLIISYIRPEFFISFLFSTFIFVFYLLKHWNYVVSKRYGILFFFSCLLLSKLFYGFPMFERNSDRFTVAFGQHYVVNKFLRESIWGIDPWLNWQNYFYPAFGRVSSMAEIFINNPKALLAHIEFNLYWISVINYVPIKDFFLPIWFFKTDLELVYFISIIGLLAIISWKKISKNFTKESVLKFIISKIAFITFILPCILSCIIIFPRQHYLYMMNVLFFTFIIFGIKSMIGNLKIKDLKIIRFTILIIILMYPGISDLKSENYFQKKHTPIKWSINFMNCHNGKINLLAREASVSVFLNDNFTCISSSKKEGEFHAFLRNYCINMIWVSDDLLSDKAYAGDKGWLDFLRHPDKSGFRKQQMAGMEGYLLVKN